MNKVLRIVITNAKLEHEKIILEVLHERIQKGVIISSDVHYGEEEKVQ